MENLSIEFKRRVKRLMRLTHSGRSWQEYFFNLTYKCPLACKYCYIDPSLEDMTLEEVDYIMSELEKDKGNYSRTITFFGGEPALKIDIIETIIKKYYHSKLPNTDEPRFRFGIITGFTVNQDRLMKLYEEYPFEMVISYDNPRNRARIKHDGTPFSSREELEKFTHLDLSRYVLLQKTVTGNEVDFYQDILELDKLANHYGVMYCWAHNRTPKGLTKETLNTFIDSYSRMIRYLVEQLLNNPTRYIPKIFATEFLRFIGRDGDSNDGGCGLMTELFISHNARIFPCSISNSNTPFFELSDKDVTEIISDAESCYLNNPTCKNCDTNTFCNGGCLVARDIKYESFGTPIIDWCNYIKGIKEAYRRVIDTLTEEEINHIANILIQWRIGYYRACTAPVEQKNLIRGDVK